MRKREPQTPTPQKHKAYVPLERSKLRDEAERLFEKYLKTFAAAPEADFLLKRYSFDEYFEKEYLQQHIFLIPRADFLWFFKYFFTADGVRTIGQLNLKSAQRAKPTRRLKLSPFRSGGFTPSSRERQIFSTQGHLKTKQARNTRSKAPSAQSRLQRSFYLISWTMA